MLEISNIHKSFGERRVLSGINIELQNGFIYTLIGPNGAGKTTLFNLVTGFLKTDEGTITFKGSRLNGLSPVAINSMGITRTFQNLRLITGLTVRENILLALKGNPGEKVLNAFLPLKFQNKNDQVLKQRADEIARTIFLTDERDTRAGELSYGQQKLLTLGCCIANDAELLLLDEPVSGINQIFKVKIVSIVKELKKNGKTILLIEHNADFIAEISDELLFLANGSITAFANYDQLKQSPVVQAAYL